MLAVSARPLLAPLDEGGGWSNMLFAIKSQLVCANTGMGVGKTFLILGSLLLTMCCISSEM